MLCDCEYAEKNGGVDQSMQLASQVEKLTLTSTVRDAEKTVFDDTLGAKQKPSTKQYNYENCSCFMINHIRDVCELCVRGCRWRAKEACEDRREERRRMREEGIFAERLANVSEERRDVVARWMGEEMEHSTA